MKKTKKAILFGTSGQAEVMDYILTVDSEYEVVAFTATKDFIEKSVIYNKPLIAFENIEKTYSPIDFEMHIAIGYNDRNKTREKFYRLAKSKGYKLLTYVSSRCTNYSKKIGDNCFIFEDNTLQPFVEIGNNCILWSGNHIGHHGIMNHFFLKFSELPLKLGVVPCMKRLFSSSRLKNLILGVILNVYESCQSTYCSINVKFGGCFIWVFSL